MGCEVGRRIRAWRQRRGQIGHRPRCKRGRAPCVGTKPDQSNGAGDSLLPSAFVVRIRKDLASRKPRSSSSAAKSLTRVSKSTPEGRRTWMCAVRHRDRMSRVAHARVSTALAGT
ncbi:hypothetical protein LC55x_0177 [Lysobacter capsici]|nr:hypothetical protein LC55x_0177 [Lysobacter capsici]